jgi:hypothetical protein
VGAVCLGVCFVPVGCLLMLVYLKTPIDPPPQVCLVVNVASA